MLGEPAGDVHGAQGDGEIAGTGIETSAEVQFTVKVIKGKPLAWPRGETAADIFTIGNARPLEQALQHATTEMLNWLEQDYGLDRLAASHVLGMAVCYDVANVFNPAFSVACRVAKTALAEQLRRSFASRMRLKELRSSIGESGGNSGTLRMKA